MRLIAAARWPSCQLKLHTRKQLQTDRLAPCDHFSKMLNFDPDDRTSGPKWQAHEVAISVWGMGWRGGGSVAATHVLASSNGILMKLEHPVLLCWAPCTERGTPDAHRHQRHLAARVKQ